jgi:4-nitrophenyl phosphatase
MTHLDLQGMIIDMDGVLWRGPDPIGNLPKVFNSIQQLGLKFILVTNNATRSVSQYEQKLKRFGVEVSTDQIINSAQATAQYLRHKFPKGGPVFVIGEEGLFQALEENNFYLSSEEALAVVVGLDRTVTYDKLRQAALLIQEGKPFICTNPDPALPSPEGLLPGTGSIIAALETTTGVDGIIIGKPKPQMYRIAIERMGTSPQGTLVVGDRLETDIVGGQTLGCPTAVVLSGVTSRSEAEAWKPPLGFVADDLGNLLEQVSSKILKQEVRTKIR